MTMSDEKKEEISGQDTIDEEVIAAIKRRMEKREEEERRTGFMRRSGRETADALYYGTSVPILVITGVLIGWYLTRDASSTVRALGVLGGAIFGLLWAVFEIIRKEKKANKK